MVVVRKECHSSLKIGSKFVQRVLVYNVSSKVAMCSFKGEVKGEEIVNQFDEEIVTTK